MMGPVGDAGGSAQAPLPSSHPGPPHLGQQLALGQQLRDLRGQHDVPVLVHVCGEEGGRRGEDTRSYKFAQPEASAHQGQQQQQRPHAEPALTVVVLLRVLRAAKEGGRRESQRSAT